MKNLDFLNKIKKEGKLEIIEPSEEIKESYLQKSENCLISSKILFQNNLYENSIAEAYYCMYNCLTALFYKTGIKSENHTASIILLKELFNFEELYNFMIFAKKERIDKQYYPEKYHQPKLDKAACSEMINLAEKFSLKIRVEIDKLNNNGAFNFRNKLKSLLR